MKLKNKILPLLLLASTAVGCTDGFETTNSDPNKLYEVNLQSIFPGIRNTDTAPANNTENSK